MAGMSAPSFSAAGSSTQAWGLSRVAGRARPDGPAGDELQDDGGDGGHEERHLTDERGRGGNWRKHVRRRRRSVEGCRQSRQGDGESAQQRDSTKHAGTIALPRRASQRRGRADCGSVTNLAHSAAISPPALAQDSLRPDGRVLVELNLGDSESVAWRPNEPGLGPSPGPTISSALTTPSVLHAPGGEPGYTEPRAPADVRRGGPCGVARGAGCRRAGSGRGRRAAARSSTVRSRPSHGGRRTLSGAVRPRP